MFGALFGGVMKMALGGIGRVVGLVKRRRARRRARRLRRARRHYR
jgi:hypothetical protein